MPVEGAGCKWTKTLAAYVDQASLATEQLVPRKTRFAAASISIGAHYEPGR
jgi:hypothetical protein